MPYFSVGSGCFFAIHYIYCLTSRIGSTFPQVKSHAVHGKNPVAQGEKTTTHLVKNNV